MGGITSRPQLQRSKSLSTFGRSSQRGLFQKSRAKLKQIDKDLQNFEGAPDSVAHDEIKKQLEDVEKELNSVSATIKEKNKQRYEEALKCLQGTREKFEGKLNPANEKVPQEPETTPTVLQTVELKLVQVVLPDEPTDVEMRTKSNATDEPPLDERSSGESASPKVKFGVQVMPISPRISQELLKRKTLPLNEGPKAEFQRIRVISESAVTGGSPKLQYQEIADPVLEENELYNAHFPLKLDQGIEQLNHSPLVENADKENQRASLVPKKPPRVVEKSPAAANALEQMESIGYDVDVLEEKLKYFSGNKGDDNYIELHEAMVKNMINLDNIDTHGDAVVKQERKIAIQRIQELLVILERLVEPTRNKENPDDKSQDDTDKDGTGKQYEEIVNAEGKPVTATAL